MNVKKILAYQIVVGLVLALLMFPAVTAYAQDPQPPEDSDQPWNPPEGAGEAFLPPGVESKSASSYYPPPRPGTPPSIIDAHLVDEAGQTRTQFGDEPFYLVVRVNSPGQFYLAEYYPAGSGLQRHWLIYRHYLDHAGSWTLGPFYALPREPEGQHTWKMWLYASGAWAQRLTYFSYQPAYPNPPPYFPTPTPNPTPAPSTGGWGSVQVLVVAVLVGALGIAAGMLISARQRYAAR